MADITHRLIDTNGIRMHIAEAGPDQGPCVIMCHGFPESWYSWRHQLHALADAGYHAVAPDMRGYGRTSRPADPVQYTQLRLVGDMVGLLSQLPHDTAVIAGHDWGAPVAWNASLFRPDLFPAVVALSVPYLARRMAFVDDHTAKPTDAMKKASGENFNYQLYFNQVGRAETDLERDVRHWLSGFFYTASGDVPPKPSPSPSSRKPTASKTASPGPTNSPLGSAPPTSTSTRANSSAPASVAASRGTAPSIPPGRRWHLTSTPSSPSPPASSPATATASSPPTAPSTRPCPPEFPTSASTRSSPAAAIGLSKSAPLRSTTPCSPSSRTSLRSDGIADGERPGVAHHDR